MYVMGWVKGQQGDLAASIKLFDDGIGLSTAIGAFFWRSFPFTWKIETLLQHRELEEARTMLERTYEELRDYQEPFMMPVLKRLEAELLLAQNNEPGTLTGRMSGVQAGVSPEARAESLYQESIALSRQWGAKSFELQALLGLFDLVRETPRALNVLEEIRDTYESMEQMDVPLLKRAQNILRVVSEESVPVGS
jgi:hypothetical protein